MFDLEGIWRVYLLVGKREEKFYFLKYKRLLGFFVMLLCGWIKKVVMLELINVS